MAGETIGGGAVVAFGNVLVRVIVMAARLCLTRGTMQWAQKNKNGFTIVELLIVVIVIAILATITIVSFNNIQNRANDSAVQADLRNFIVAMTSKKELGEITQYPAGNDGDLNVVAFKFSHTSYDVSTGALLYCTDTNRTFSTLHGRSKSGTQFYYTTDGRSGTTTTSFGSYPDMCSPFTNSSNATFARFGRSGGAWNSWTRP